MDIYLNGHMLPPDQAALPISDSGFQHAVGLFETMQAHHGRVFRLDRHMARIAKSARQLGLVREMDTDALAAAVQKTIQHNQLTQARIRLTITPGTTPGNYPLRDRISSSSSPLKPQASSLKPTLIIVAQEPTVYDPAYFETGITVIITLPAANPFDEMAGHKTLNYWQRLRTLRQSAAVEAGEAIWLNITNHLASGAISNVFLVRDGKLLTPIARGEEVEGALPAPVLPGITRQAIMEIARHEGIETETRMLSASDLLDSDEVFLTNSSWNVLPVTKVEKKSIGDGQVGDVTRSLRQKLLAMIEQETLA